MRKTVKCQGCALINNPPHGDNLKLSTVNNEIKYYFSKQVHLCEAEGIQDFLVEDLCMVENNESSLLVAVKTLREDANKNARYSQLAKALQLAAVIRSSVKLISFLAVLQERLSERNSDHVPPEGPQHCPSVGCVHGHRPTVHDHRVHGKW